jgi:hypothetical protein
MCVTDAMTRLLAAKRAGLSVTNDHDFRRAAAGFRVASRAACTPAAHLFAAVHWPICTRAINVYLPFPSGLKIDASPSLAISDDDEGYPKLLFDTIDKRLLKSETLNSTFARS